MHSLSACGSSLPDREILNQDNLVLDVLGNEDVTDLNQSDQDNFNRMAGIHVQVMFSKLIAEHQLHTKSLQSEINLLRDKLQAEQPTQAFGIKFCCREVRSGQRNESQDANCAFDFNTTTLPECKSTILSNDARPDGEATRTSVKLDTATVFTRHASSGNLDELTVDHVLEPSSQKPWLDKFRSFLHSNTFEVLTGLLILANTMIMAVQAQYNGLDAGYAVRPGIYPKPARETWPGAENVFQLASVFMKWMWFDTVIVTMSLLDLMSGNVDVGIDPKMVRLVRLIRLVRLLKVFKAMSAFDSLFLLLKSIYASVSALFWSFLLLVGVQTGVALFLCQMLQPIVSNEENSIVVRDEAFKYFGTFYRAMMTMFEITLANWVPVCRFLTEEVHESYFLFFLVYRCLFCFSVLKVISAVFISETNRVLASDAELSLMRAHREGSSFKHKLEVILSDMSRDMCQAITWSDMQMFLSKDDSSAELSTIGIDRHEFEKIFWLLEVDGAVDVNKFLSMVGQLRGQAKTVDLLNVFKLMHKIDEKLDQVVHFEEHDYREQLLPKLASCVEGGRSSGVVPTRT